MLYENIGENDVKYENKKIVQVQSKLYLIEYNFDFETSDTKTNHEEVLDGLLTEFKQEGFLNIWKRLLIVNSDSKASSTFVFVYSRLGNSWNIFGSS